MKNARWTEADLSNVVREARAKFGVPAIAAAAMSSDAVHVQVVEGMRVSGRTDLATLDDYFHIGSYSKSVLAVMVAKLVEARHRKAPAVAARHRKASAVAKPPPSQPAIAKPPPRKAPAVAARRRRPPSQSLRHRSPPSQSPRRRLLLPASPQRIDGGHGYPQRCPRCTLRIAGAPDPSLAYVHEGLWQSLR